MDIRLDEIVIGDRVRKDMGDLRSLAQSIEQHGLLHPVVLKKDRTLVAGHRRIEAARLMGWAEIAATVIDVNDLLSAERDENTERKDFTPTEAVAIGRLIEERERPAAKERMRQASIRNAATAARDDKGRMLAAEDHGKGESPTHGQEQVREVAARAVGFGMKKYEQAKQVVAAAEREPEKYGDLPERMDETGSVLGAHKEMRLRANGKAGRHPIHHKLHDRKPNQMMQKAVLAFDGLCMGLQALDVSQLDPTQTKDWARSLAKAATFLRRLSKKVANVKAGKAAEAQERTA